MVLPSIDYVLITLLVLLFVPLFPIHPAKECRSKERQTLVALTFDDGYSCWTSAVMPILKRHGLPATAFINHPNRRENFSWADIQELYKAGWEIGWHTAWHDFVDIAPRFMIIDDFNNCWDLFKAHGLPPPTSFAYPNGRHDLNSIEIVSAHFVAARTLHYGVDSVCSVRKNPAHLTTILFERGLPFIKEQLKRHSRHGVLVIFTGHTVGQAAKWQTSPDLTVEEFADFAEFLHQKKQEGSIDVVSFGEGASRMQQREASSHWRLKLESPFHPWFKVSVIPIPRRYIALYERIVHDLVGHRYPRIACWFDRWLFELPLGFFLILVVLFSIVALIVVIAINHGG